MSIIVATAGGISSLETETGNVIKSYKTSEPFPGGTVVLRGSSGPSTLLVAQRNKALIHSYQLRKEGVHKRIVMPAKLSAISLSPCGRWLAAGSHEGSIYVWNMLSSALLTLQTEAHFQAVTALDWSADSQVLVSGGADARVLVWRSADLVANPGRPPKHALTLHSLAVVSVKIGAGSFREARLFTASLDSTCCVFDIFSGTLLYTLVADSRITTMTVDPAERAIYLGCDDGIHAVPLYFESSHTNKLVAVGSEESSVISTNTVERIFKAPSETPSAFTAFSLSPDGIYLVSGSDDGTVASWEVGSGQLLRNYRATKGSICQILHESQAFSQSEVNDISLLQRNVESANAVTDFVPWPQQRELSQQFFARSLIASTNVSGEIDSIFEFANTANSKAVSDALNGAYGDSTKLDPEDSEASETSSKELEGLKQRYDQLKKMYDELWTKYAATS